MKLGVAIPVIDPAVGGDPNAIRDFAQAAEDIGYHDLSVPDHVLGVNVASRPDWGDRNTSADLFQDPFVVFGFLAGCTRAIGFSTQVLILAQRQAVLVAKQAACVDVLCGGRLHGPERDDHPGVQGPVPARGHDHLEGRDQLAAQVQGGRP